MGRIGWWVLAAGAFWLVASARAQPGDEEEIRSAAPPAQPSAETATPRRAFAGYAAESARTATRLSAEEREARAFLRSMAAAARFEAEAARLAAQRAGQPPVREFAGDLLQYHQQGQGVELLHLLQARGMAPPMMDNAQRRALQRLARLSGAPFDREYLEVAGARRQREEVQQLERAMPSLGDPALRAWAERQLPALRSQAAAAEALGPAARREASRPVALTPVGARRQRTE